jgi:hypothetical protein
LKNTIKENYALAEDKTVDECMVKFNGRISYMQYKPKMPVKRGYKIWLRADKFGYVLWFSVI